MKKRFFSLLVLVSVLVGCFSIQSFAAPQPIKVFLNGTQLSYDVQPQIINERTMVPLSITIQFLTKVVPDWDDSTKTVSFTYDGKFYSHKVGEKVLYTDGKSTTFDTPSLIIDSRTLVPIRMLSDGLGMETQWDPNTYTVILTSKASVTPPVQTNAAQINTVNPGSTNPSSLVSGHEATIMAYANSATTQVKLVDDLDSSREVVVRDYEVISGEHVFTIKWTPTEGTGQRLPKIYAGTDSAFGQAYKTAYINIITDEKAFVQNAIPDISNMTVGGRVDVTIVTNNAVTRVWLNVPGEGDILQNSTNYTTSGNTKTWTLSWYPRSAGYMTCYAYGADNGNNQDYHPFLANITGQTSDVTIYSLTADKNNPSFGDFVTFECRTSNNVTSVDFEIGSATAEMARISSDGNGILWRTNLRIQQSGVISGEAIAHDSSTGIVAEQPITLTVGGTSVPTITGDASISDMYSEPSATAYLGETVHVVVQTGPDAGSVMLSWEGHAETAMENTAGMGGTNTWELDCPITTHTNGHVTFNARTLPDVSSGALAGSQYVTITVSN